MEETKKEGIGLYKIVYEIDKKGEKRSRFIAGILAHNSKEAVDTLFNFCKEKIKKFKGLAPSEVSYQGLCHAVSDRIRKSIINKALNDGIVIRMEDHEAMLKKVKKTVKKEKEPKVAKKSIIKEK